MRKKRTDRPLSHAPDDGFALFRDIVSSMPREVRAFFDSFSSSRESMSLQLDAESLNAAAADEYRACRSKGQDSVLFKWFEVFRDIYIAAKVQESEDGLEVLKNPDNFSTFTRSFEPLAALPEFWFGDESLASRARFRDRVYALRFAFERFLYSRAGARAWGAFDWEMPRYVRERLCGRLRTGDARALKRVAAIALTARAVAAEDLGVYIEEFDDVQLPLTGISNVRGQTKPLLKYFHYDRFTQLSYAREHEFAADVNFPGDHVEFEQRWLALAVISDFALKEADAHSTLFCATRAAFESVSRFLSRVKRNLSRKDVPRLRKAVDFLAPLFADSDSADIARMSNEEILRGIGLTLSPVDADWYLVKSGVDSAGSFWRQAMPVFDELVALVNKNRDETIPKYTERQRKSGFRDRASAEEFIRHAIDYSNPSELREIPRADFLRHFSRMLSEGDYELDSLSLSEAVLGDDEEAPRSVKVWSQNVGQTRMLPAGLPFGDGERKAFRGWIYSVWSALARSRPLEDARSTAVSRRQVDYSVFDYKAILEAADLLWNHYFTADKLCMERWVLSIARAIEIIDKCEKNSFASWRFDTGFVWPCDPDRRRVLRARLTQEKASLVKAGVWPRDMKKMKTAFLSREPLTINTVVEKRSRYYVMLAVFARLMAETAENHPALWNNKDELFSFFIHILIATNEALDYPLPCHLGIYRDSYLRTGRSRTRQRNAVDSIVDGRFGNEAERQIFMMYFAHYLKRSGNGAAIVKAASCEESIVSYFGKPRFSFLRGTFLGGAD